MAEKLGPNTIKVIPVDARGTRGQAELLTEVPTFADKYRNDGPTQEPLNKFNSLPMLDPTVPNHVVIGGSIIGGDVSVLIGENRKGEVHLGDKILEVHVPNLKPQPIRNSWDLNNIPEGGHRTRKEIECALEGLQVSSQIDRFANEKGEEVEIVAL